MKRPLLAPLTPLYAAVTGLRGTAYDHQMLKPEKLRYPVLSVGNIAAGGSGKTPLVIALAKLLTSQGCTVDVLSRGYGRQTTETLRVDPEGTAYSFGDEPLLIARAAQVPVYVGSSRYEAGLLAEQQCCDASRRLHLLDDGFQHRQLARNVDLVLVNRSDLTDALLPGGNLREPLAALRRAHFLFVREEEQEIVAELRARGFKQEIFLMRRTMEIPASPGPVTAFCGIAKPQDFWRGLEQQGISLAGKIDFRDHHPYSLEDATSLVALASKTNSSAFLTTEKDFVKLEKPILDTLQDIAPVLQVKLRTEILGNEAFLAALRAQGSVYSL